jgi:hypothetical protein
VLEAFALAACALLGAMALVICADVLLRNVELIPGVDGLPWSNELSETTLYVVTMLAAPWLLREGRHIRVDIVLRAIPPRAGWLCEWLCDAIALGCCVCMVIMQRAQPGRATPARSASRPSCSEWWTSPRRCRWRSALSVEMLFRMHPFVAARAPAKTRSSS